MSNAQTPSVPTQDRFDQLLPFYVNGTLSTADQQWFETIVTSNPQAMAQVQFYQRMAKTMQARYDAVPDTIGLDKTLARIAAQTTTAQSPSPTAPNASNQRSSWLANLLSGGWMKPALALSMVVMGVQAVMLFNRPTKPEPIVYRGADTAGVVKGATNTDTPSGVYVRVLVKPTTTDGEWRLILATSKAWIVGGPGGSGEYYLRLAPADSAAGIETIKASGLALQVESVSAVPKPTE
jgi:hypothetical protein